MSSAAAAESTPDIHNAASQIQMAKDGYGEQEVLPTRTELGVWYLYEISSFSCRLPTPPPPPPPPPLPLPHHLAPPSIPHVPDIGPSLNLGQRWRAQALPAQLLSLIMGGRCCHLGAGDGLGRLPPRPRPSPASYLRRHRRRRSPCLPPHRILQVAVAVPPLHGVVASASTVAAAGHARHLGLLVRGFAGTVVRRSEFQARQAVAGWLSTCGTPAGFLCAAVVAPSPTRCSGSPTDRRVCGSFPS